MSLIKCSECGKEYSDKAKACPVCACPTEANTGEVSKNESKEERNVKPTKIKEVNNKKNNDKKYETEINIIHSFRTNRIINKFIRKHKFQENNPLFGKDESGYKRYYRKGVSFNYKIDNGKLKIEAYENFLVSIPCENGHVTKNHVILPMGRAMTVINNLICDLKRVNGYKDYGEKDKEDWF